MLIHSMLLVNKIRGLQIFVSQLKGIQKHETQKYINVLYGYFYYLGGRGKCIRSNGQWFTPNEWETYCGR